MKECKISEDAETCRIADFKINVNGRVVVYTVGIYSYIFGLMLSPCVNDITGDHQCRSDNPQPSASGEEIEVQ